MREAGYLRTGEPVSSPETPEDISIRCMLSPAEDEIIHDEAVTILTAYNRRELTQNEFDQQFRELLLKAFRQLSQDGS